MATKLFVGNLSFQTTDEDLKNLFGQIGAVASANVIMDKFTGKSRGFGFVEMTTTQDVQQAVERFHGTDLHGRPLTVNEAKPQESRGGSRSFGRGGNDRGGHDRRW